MAPQFLMNEQEKHMNSNHQVTDFDVTRAQAGAVVVLAATNEKVRWVARTHHDMHGNIIERMNGSVAVRHDDELRIENEPLMWLYGKPVHVGSVLYRPSVSKHPLTVIGLSDCGEYVRFAGNMGTEFADNRRGYLFWNLPFPRSVQLKCFRRDWTFLLIENPLHVPEGYVAYPLGDRWLDIDDV